MSTTWGQTTPTDEDLELIALDSWDRPLNPFGLPSQAYVRLYVEYFYGRTGSIAEYDNEYLDYRPWSLNGTISCFRCTFFQMWGFDVQIEQRPEGGFRIFPGLPDQHPFQCQRCGQHVWNFRICW
jgi:hypothetical protein